MLTTQELTSLTGGLAAGQTTLVRATNPLTVEARSGLYVIGRDGFPRYVGQTHNLNRKMIAYYRLSKVLDARAHLVNVWYIYGFPNLRDRRLAEARLIQQLQQWLLRRGRRGLFNAQRAVHREFEWEL